MNDFTESFTKFIIDNTEIIGIIAGVFVLISFLMKKIRVIRMISIIGCIFFVIYGVLISAWSVWVLNAILILIHIFYLAMSGRRKPCPPSEERRLQKFHREAFDKKGLRDLPWFVTGDLD